jgi:DNA-binding response OmpR family regulator
MAQNGGSYYLRIGLLGRWLAQKYTEIIFRPPPIDSFQRSVVSDSLEPDSDPFITMDDLHKRVYLGEEELDLTPQEYQLLGCLAIKAGQVVSRDELAEIIWPKDNYAYGISDSRIDAALARLRRKLGNEARHYLKTVRGRGFLLAEEAVRYISSDPDD